MEAGVRAYGGSVEAAAALGNDSVEAGQMRMQCAGCGSAAVTERSERTTQGYRRFRYRRCGKQLNERTGTVRNRAQYPSDVIALVVV